MPNNALLFTAEAILGKKNTLPNPSFCVRVKKLRRFSSVLVILVPTVGEKGIKLVFSGVTSPSVFLTGDASPGPRFRRPC